jgi:hypothetical protein
MHDFVGRWRIRERQTWSKELVDLLEPGFFEFGDGGLHARPRGADERVLLVVNEQFQITQQSCQLIRRRWYKGGVTRPGATDPVLRASHFPGLLAGTAHPVKQHAVSFAEQSHTDGQFGRIAQIVANFLNIVCVTDRKSCLLVEQIGERYLGASDLRSAR